MNRIATLTMALGLAMTGCGKKEETPTPPAAAPTDKAPTAAQPAAPKPTLWEGHDLNAELARLEGTWQVRTNAGGRDADTWAITGDQITITRPDGTTQLGKLLMPMPGQLGVKTGDMTSFYAYARDGERLWIGLGDGGVKVGDRYFVGADRGVVAFDGTTCRYHGKKLGFGGPIEFEAPVEVKCAIQTGGDQTVLHYQVPRFMKDGEFDDEQIRVVGTALMNEQLEKEHLVIAGAAAAPPAPPPAEPEAPDEE